MRLVDNIECVLKHAWTVRLIVVTTVLDAAQASVSFFAGTEIFSPPVLAALNVGLSVAALGARMVAQEKVSPMVIPLTCMVLLRESRNKSRTRSVGSV